MVPPPQRSTKINATTDIVGYFRLQDCPEVCWQNLGSRLKPIEPIEISIGTTIQDPRSKIPREDPCLDLGSWIPSPIEISIGLIGFNRHTDYKHVHMIIHAHTQAYTVRLSKHIHTLSTSVCRLKPIKPIEISIGARIQDPRSKIAQGSSLRILDLGSWILVPIEISIGSIGFNRDPRFCQQTSGQSWILDLGSHPRLKFQSV